MSDLVRAYLQHLQASGRSPETVRHRAGVLSRLHRDLPYGADCAAAEELEAWLADPAWSAWTRYAYHVAIADFYGWLTEGSDPWLDWNPAAELIRPPNPGLLPDPVTDEELTYVLEHSDDWWCTIVLLAVLAGLRCGEICQLHREDVTAETIRVRRGKGGRAGIVDTHPDLWVRLAPRPPGHVVTGRRTGRPLAPKYLTNQARIHFNRLGMPDVHLHRFRHYAGTAIQRATGNIRVTQRFLRHKSVVSAEGYTLILDEERRRAVNQLRLPATVQGSQTITPVRTRAGS